MISILNSQFSILKFSNSQILKFQILKFQIPNSQIPNLGPDILIDWQKELNIK